MAGHLAAAGYKLTVHDLDPAVAKRVKGSFDNVVVASTAAEVAPRAEVVITMLPDGTAMNNVLNESTGMSWITRNHIEQRILSRTFDDPFRLELMLEDIGIATALAKEQHVPMTLSGRGEELYRAAVTQPDRGQSISAIVRWVEQQMGTEIR